MSRTLYASLLMLSAGLALFLAGATTFKNEAIYAVGNLAYLKIEPRDPRSLLQGDYMRLNYKADGQVDEQDNPAWAIVALDDRGIGTVLSFQPSLSGLGLDDEPGLIAIPVQKVGNQALIQPRSFFFQEGLSSDFDAASYAVFKYQTSRDALLFGLATKDFQLIVSKE